MPGNDYNTPPVVYPDNQPELGDIKINHDVVAAIVRLAAQQVPGVAAVGGGIADEITDLLSKSEASKRGVKIVEDTDDAYAIEVRIIITYGHEIARTAYDVQVSVRKQITGMTGKNVHRVDVIVEGVRLPAAPGAPARPDSLWPGIATD